MIQSLLDQILSDTMTYAKALEKVSILKDYLTIVLFTAPQECKTAIPNQFSEEQINWLNSLGQDFFHNFNKDNVYSLCSQMEEEIKKIEHLVIFLPFIMPDEGILKLGQTLRGSFGKNFLFDLKYDPALIAGPALVWQGIYRDYSLRQKINDNRQTILAILKQRIH